MTRYRLTYTQESLVSVIEVAITITLGIVAMPAVNKNHFQGNTA